MANENLSGSPAGQVNFGTTGSFNPFITPHTNPRGYYADTAWRKFLNSLSLDDVLREGRNPRSTGLIENEAAAGSIFYYVLTNCDFPGAPSKIIKVLLKEREKENPLTYWNSSMEELFNTLYPKDSDESIKAYFNLDTLIHADAGYSFEEEPWVMPWVNRQNKTYSEIRDIDKINAVLKSQLNLQFTTRNRFEIDLAAEEYNYPKVHHNEEEFTTVFDRESAYFNYDDAKVHDVAVIFSFQGGGNVQGIYVNNETIRFLSQKELEELIEEKNRWMRLIMPKYIRNVEVEDLNRNFWVIGQVLNQLLYYLFDPEGILGKLLKGLGDEIEEMWNNIEYLWAATLYSDLPDEVTWHVETIVLNDMDYDYGVTYSAATDTQFRLKRDIENPEKDEIFKRLQYLKHQYPKQNLAIIPCYRFGFYEENHYSAFTIYGLMYLQRFTTDENGKVIPNTNADFQWYRSITPQTYTADSISKNNLGSGFYDNGINFEYCSLNLAKYEDEKYYCAYRPIITVKQTINGISDLYDFNDDELPSDLSIDVVWHDAVYEGMESGNKKSYDDLKGNNHQVKSGPEPVEILNQPSNGFYLGELVSKKIALGNIFILPREFRVPILGGNNTSLELRKDNKIFRINSNFDQMKNKYKNMAYAFSQRMYDYIKEGAEAENLENKESIDSIWVFRMTTVERYSNLNEDKITTIDVIDNNNNITMHRNFFPTDIESNDSTEKAEMLEPSGLYKHLFFESEGGKLYRLNTSINSSSNNPPFGVPQLLFRSNATLFYPLNTQGVNYECHIENDFGNPESKKFIVLCKDKKINKDNWIIVFLYGCGEANTNHQKNVITFFYPPTTTNSQDDEPLVGQCETISLLYDSVNNVWKREDYYQNQSNDMKTTVINMNDGDGLPLWNTHMNGIKKIYAGRLVNPDSTTQNLMLDSLNLISGFLRTTFDEAIINNNKEYQIGG